MFLWSVFRNLECKPLFYAIILEVLHLKKIKNKHKVYFIYNFNFLRSKKYYNIKIILKKEFILLNINNKNILFDKILKCVSKFCQKLTNLTLVNLFMIYYIVFISVFGLVSIKNSTM